MTEPKLMTEAGWRKLLCIPQVDDVLKIVRERGLIASEPDPKSAAWEEFSNRIEPGCEGVSPQFVFDAGFDAAMELAPRVELTREMVLDAYLSAFPLGLGEAGNAFVDRFHAALQEQLKEAGRGA